MKLIIASNNAHKIVEIKQILGHMFDDVQGLQEAGYSIDVVEDGNSFRENAMKKAVEVAKITACAALSDDSGLCVDALDGAPGIYSARYSGEAATTQTNNAKLLAELGGVPEPRRAQYVCDMVLCFPDGDTICASGVCQGQILQKEMGEGGFGYDPLFMPDGYTKSFGLIPAEEKNRISHRFKALQGILAQLEEKR